MINNWLGKSILLCLTLFILVLACETETRVVQAQPALRITSPLANATVKGSLTLTVEAANLPGLASIEFLRNGQFLSGPLTTAPYGYSWNSHLVWDGPASLQAIARAADGAVLAESAVVPFTIDNGPGSIRLLSPDPTQTLSGTVSLQVRANYLLSPEEVAAQQAEGVYPKPIEALTVFIDGQKVHHQWGAPKLTFNLDTRRFANGRHTLFVGAYAHIQGAPPVAMLQLPLTFDNGRVVRDVRPQWSRLFLTPGQTADLAPRAVFTNGDEQPYAGAVAYTSSASGVASVSGAGRVMAVAPGIASITAVAANHTSTTLVQVGGASEFRHFARDGQMLTQYDPTRSLFVRSVFNLDANWLTSEANPGMVERARAAGINALTTGFYQNPADGTHRSLASWVSGYDSWWDEIEATARDHNFSLVLSGDDMARTTAELADSIGITNSWGPEALKHALTKARDSKVAVAIEAIDEANMLWGDTPKPTDGRWLDRTPSIPDDAFVRLMGVVNGVPHRLPISFPVLGHSSHEEARNWTGDPAFSDYTSHYWVNMDWRAAYPYGNSLGQDREGLSRVVIERLPVLHRPVPALLLTGLTGPWYRKRGAAPTSGFTPGEDELLSPGHPVPNVSAQIMYAAATGMAGVRSYGFDGRWAEERAQAGVGAELQTGASPFTAGQDRWAAMSAAFNLIRQLEPHLLQPQMNAVDLGPSVVTGARRGPQSHLLMAVNFSEGKEKVTVDLSPYRYAGGSVVVRYRLQGTTLTTDTVPDVSLHQIELGAGETVVWLFRPTSS